MNVLWDWEIFSHFVMPTSRLNVARATRRALKVEHGHDKVWRDWHPILLSLHVILVNNARVCKSMVP